MHCPVDNATLSMTDRSGVEIDYCPAVQGSMVRQRRAR
jgi:Zn-finger nucleic acid-binding protein